MWHLPGSKRRKNEEFFCDELLPADTSPMTSLLAKFSCRLSQRGERRNELGTKTVLVVKSTVDLFLVEFVSGMDQAVFQRQLQTSLKQHPDYPQVG